MLRVAAVAGVLLSLTACATAARPPAAKPDKPAILDDPDFLRIVLHCYYREPGVCNSLPDEQPPTRCVRQSNNTLDCQVTTSSGNVSALCRAGGATGFEITCEPVAPSK